MKYDGEVCLDDKDKLNEIIYKMHCCTTHDIHLDSVQKLEPCKYLITMSLYEACFSNHTFLKTFEIWILAIFLSVFGYCSLGILQNLMRGMKFSIRVIPNFPFWFKLYKKLQKSNPKQDQSLDKKIDYQNLPVTIELEDESLYDWFTL